MDAFAALEIELKETDLPDSYSTISEQVLREFADFLNFARREVILAGIWGSLECGKIHSEFSLTGADLDSYSQNLKNNQNLFVRLRDGRITAEEYFVQLGAKDDTSEFKQLSHFLSHYPLTMSGNLRGFLRDNSSEKLTPELAFDVCFDRERLVDSICSQNSDLPSEDVNIAIDRMVRRDWKTFDGTLLMPPVT